MKGKMELREYISENLKEQLVKDLKKYRIFCEADLHACSYYHLRKFVKGGKKWSIYNKSYEKKLSVYPDMIIKKLNSTRIVIEFKNDRLFKKIKYEKDIAKLHNLYLKGHTRKLTGFFIYLLREEKRLEQDIQNMANSIKLRKHRWHIFPIIINIYDPKYKIDTNEFKKRWEFHKTLRLI